MNNIQYDAAKCHFSFTQNGHEVGYLTYRLLGSTWEINHTVVSPKHQGQGLARQLVEAAIAEAKTQNIGLQASCSYADKILAEHS